VKIFEGITHNEINNPLAQQVRMKIVLSLMPVGLILCHIEDMTHRLNSQRSDNI
jgi:hypothetical protein